MATVILFGDRDRLTELKNLIMRKGDCSFAVYDDAAAAAKDVQERAKLGLVVIDQETSEAATAVMQAADVKGVPTMTIDATKEDQRQAVIAAIKGGT